MKTLQILSNFMEIREIGRKINSFNQVPGLTQQVHVGKKPHKIK